MNCTPGAVRSGGGAEGAVWWGGGGGAVPGRVIEDGAGEVEGGGVAEQVKSGSVGDHLVAVGDWGGLGDQAVAFGGRERGEGIVEGLAGGRAHDQTRVGLAVGLGQE